MIGVTKEIMGRFEVNDKILISNIPANRIKTVYSVIGDIFVYINIVFTIVFGLIFRGWENKK